jgi:hypothetical protein
MTYTVDQFLNLKLLDKLPMKVAHLVDLNGQAYASYRGCQVLSVSVRATA